MKLALSLLFLFVLGSSFGQGVNERKTDVANHFGADNSGGCCGPRLIVDTVSQRKVISHFQPNFKVTKKTTFTFKVGINANGDIIIAQVVKGSTTTKDQLLINKVILSLKKQVKYEKLEEGTPTMVKLYTATILPE